MRPFGSKRPEVERDIPFIFALDFVFLHKRGPNVYVNLPVREWLKKKLFKSAIKREESDARINSSEREQARPKVKSAVK